MVVLAMGMMAYVQEAWMADAEDVKKPPLAHFDAREADIEDTACMLLVAVGTSLDTIVARMEHADMGTVVDSSHGSIQVAVGHDFAASVPDALDASSGRGHYRDQASS
jgi:hypothetical protein